MILMAGVPPQTPTLPSVSLQTKKKGMNSMNRTKHSLYLLILGVTFYCALPVLAMTYEAPLGAQISHTLQIFERS